MIKFCCILSCMFLLQACIHKVVTVPTKVVYKTCKGAVKGTAKVGGAVIPDGEDNKD